MGLTGRFSPDCWRPRFLPPAVELVFSSVGAKVTFFCFLFAQWWAKLDLRLYSLECLVPGGTTCCLGNVASGGVDLGNSVSSDWVLICLLEALSPAFCNHDDLIFYCCRIPNVGSCLTWNWGLTRPVVRLSTNETLRPWWGDCPKYMPTWDLCFHLWKGWFDWRAASRTNVGHPKGL